MLFDEADKLQKEILVFLNKQGGAYRQIKNVGTIQKNILTALATGRYFYDKSAFVCWTFINDVLFVQEAAGDLSKIRRVLRKQIKKGMSWNRPERNKVIFSATKRS